LREAPVIRVIIADDHHLVRQGIRALLEKADGIQVVGEAADGQEAVELVERLAPDVLVMDVAMPRLSGIQAIARVRGLGVATQVVMLSMYSDETLVRQALRNGAKGYLLKRSVTEELLLAVRAASQGEIYLSPAVSKPIVTNLLTLRIDTDAPSPFEQLTSREREVLQLIAEGHTNCAIAQTLKISVKTVEKHRANLMSKLDVHDVAGLTRVAIKHGLIFLDE
jgi:DNA-binding NarL/FixJ family response regulator